MAKKTVHVIIEGGCVTETYADCDVDVIVYDLDTEDPEMLANTKAAIAELCSNSKVQPVEIF